MNLNLKGKKAVVTGGSRGIGKEIAIELAKSGADVAIIYSGNEEKAKETCEQISSFGVLGYMYKCNVQEYANVEAVCKKIIEDFEGVDILVNNAGIIKDGLILRMSEQMFDDVIDVNLKGAFNFIKHLSRFILKSKSGRIINISSISGIMGNPGQANYSSAKAGLIGLTKTAAKEFSSRGVTVNAIAPGVIDTDMTASMPDAPKNMLLDAIPLKRMGRAEEIAKLAVYLSSEEAGYITGQVISIDGGLSM